MIKRLLTLVIFATCALSLSAEGISMEEAQQKAAKFARQHMIVSQNAPIRRAAAGSTDALMLPSPYYAFNIGCEGYVVVAGDDLMGDVVMYAERGSFDLQAIPQNMRSFLTLMEATYHYVQQNGSLPQSMTAKRAPNMQDIAPFVTTHWNQSNPYNMACPVLPLNHFESRSLTGCVATAMGQIMATYRHPAATTAEIPAYTFTYMEKPYTVNAMDAGTAIDWTNMKDDYTETSGQMSKADSAVANLMALCGASVKMFYGHNETGGSISIASDAAGALVDFFDYEESTVRNINRREYSYADWAAIIYQELAERRPVLYYGQSQQNGHAFVCDGYQETDGTGFFHINWGWGGLADAYVNLRICMPEIQGAGGGNYGYAMSQGAVIGIQPNDGKVSPAAKRLTVDFIQTKNLVTQYSRQSAADDFPAMGIVYQVINYHAGKDKFDLGLRLSDSEDKTIQVFTSSMTQNVEMASYTGSMVETSIGFSASLPQGSYRITPVCRLSGMEEWQADLMAESRYIALTKSEYTITIDKMFKKPEVNLSITDDISISGDKVAGHPHRAAFTLKNEGTDFHDDLFFTLNEEGIVKTFYFGCFAEVSSGNSIRCYIDFTPNQSGMNTLKIYTPDKKTLLGTAQVEVAGAPNIKYSTVNVADFDAEQEAIVNSTTFDITVKLTNEGSADFNSSYRVYLCSSKDIADPFNHAEYVKSEDWTRVNYENWDNISLKPGEATEQQFVFSNLDKRFTPNEVPYNERVFFLLLANKNDGYDWFYGDAYKVINITGISVVNSGKNAIDNPVYTLQGVKINKDSRPAKPGIYIRNGRKIIIK